MWLGVSPGEGLREDKLMLAASTEHQDLTHDAGDAAVQIARASDGFCHCSVRNEERRLDVCRAAATPTRAYRPSIWSSIIVDGDSCDATRDIVRVSRAQILAVQSSSSTSTERRPMPLIPPRQHSRRSTSHTRRAHRYAEKLHCRLPG